MTEPQKSQTKALRLLQRIYDQTRNGGGPIFVAEPGQATDPNELEAQAAWRYLRDRGLIETFNLDYTARINAAGIHAIEDVQRNPDAPIQAFPSVTYNYVTNTTNIGTAIHSPVQQAGAHSTQTVTYPPEQRVDLARFVADFTAHFGELQLDASAIKRANAQLETLRAQLTDEPDPVIVQQAGRTLRNITEGTIGSLLATAAQPAVWAWIAKIMPILFP